MTQIRPFTTLCAFPNFSHSFMHADDPISPDNSVVCMSACLHVCADNPMFALAVDKRSYRRRDVSAAYDEANGIARRAER